MKKALTLGTQIFLNYRKGDISQWMEAAQYIKKVFRVLSAVFAYCLLDFVRSLCFPSYQEFDASDPTWHCIVGTHFGSYVTHETHHIIYFAIGQIQILLFKHG